MTSAVECSHSVREGTWKVVLYISIQNYQTNHFIPSQSEQFKSCHDHRLNL